MGDGPLRHLGAKVLVGEKPPADREPSMNEITTVGLDLAKNVFQVHGLDAEGTTVLRKQLRRAQVLAFFSKLRRCLLGMEACATPHYWARELRAGRLLPLVTLSKLEVMKCGGPLGAVILTLS
jgi:hypothetical protein